MKRIPDQNSIVESPWHHYTSHCFCLAIHSKKLEACARAGVFPSTPALHCIHCTNTQRQPSTGPSLILPVMFLDSGHGRGIGFGLPDEPAFKLLFLSFSVCLLFFIFSLFELICIMSHFEVDRCTLEFTGLAQHCRKCAYSLFCRQLDEIDTALCLPCLYLWTWIQEVISLS